MDWYTRGALLTIFLAALIFRLPTPLDPTVWNNAPDLPRMEGSLAPNSRLEGAEHLHEDTAFAWGPESFATGDDGSIYTGLADGRVIQVDARGENPRDIFFTGGFVSEAGRALSSSNGIDYAHNLLGDCRRKLRTKQLKPDDERTCGRPLGERWHDGKLYVLDAYHGLFELDMAEGGQAKHLINSKTENPRALGSSAQHSPAALEVSLPLLLLNDLEIAPSGAIYLTDTSWKNERSANRVELFDASPRGRLVRFDPKTRELETVLCGLHFPNGVELDPSKTKLLVVESMRFRILELDLDTLERKITSGEHPTPLREALKFCGESEHLPDGVRIFAQSLPGFVDGLRYDEAMEGYLAAAGNKVSQPFSALYTAIKAPAIWRIVLTKLLPKSVIEKLSPKYGLVFVLDTDGVIKESMHDTTGRTAYISSALRHPQSGYMFLGSSQNPYLGRVRS